MKKYISISMLQSVCTLCLGVGLTIGSARAYATEPYQVFKKDRFDFNLDTSFFRSSANFDSNANAGSLPYSNYYQIINVTPSVRWGFLDQVGLKTGFNIGSAESSDNLATRKNSTLNRIDFGGDYLFLSHQNYELFLDLMYSHPLEKVDLNADSVTNSSGAAEFKPVVYGRMVWGELFPYGYTGINYRSEGLSMLMLYGAGLDYHLSTFAVGTALKGFASVTDDSKTSQAYVRENFTNRVNAGSKKYYSVNPSELNLELNLSTKFSTDLLMRFYTSYTIYGSNTAQGFTVGAQMNWAFGDFFGGASSSDSSRLFKKTPANPVANPTPAHQNTISTPAPNPVNTNQPKPQKKFIEDTDDGVDQNYFKPVRPIQEEYVQPIEEKKPEEKKQKIISPSQDQGIQNDLKQLDYTIKLRKIKKKKQK